MRKFLYGAMSITLALNTVLPVMATSQTTPISSESKVIISATAISLSDEGILVDGKKAST